MKLFYIFFLLFFSCSYLEISQQSESPDSRVEGDWTYRAHGEFLATEYAWSRYKTLTFEGNRLETYSTSHKVGIEVYNSGFDDYEWKKEDNAYYYRNWKEQPSDSSIYDWEKLDIEYVNSTNIKFTTHSEDYLDGYSREDYLDDYYKD